MQRQRCYRRAIIDSLILARRAGFVTTLIGLSRNRRRKQLKIGLVIYKAGRVIDSKKDFLRHFRPTLKSLKTLVCKRP